MRQQIVLIVLLAIELRAGHRVIVSLSEDAAGRLAVHSLGGLIKSGLSVGRDVMATMVNTLILAYAGTSIPLFLMFRYTNFGYSAALNAETVAGEVIRALCGSIGLIMTIPLTVTFATFLAGGQRSTKQRRRVKPRSGAVKRNEHSPAIPG